MSPPPRPSARGRLPAGVSRLRRPPARQGPGAMPAGLLASLDLGLARRGAGLLPGERRSAGLGQGTELAQLRPYQPGDDVRQLDAAATARTTVPHVRLRVPERTLTTWLAVDVSASMAFGTADRLKSDVAEGAALTIGRLALRRAGRLAVGTFGAGRPRLLPPHGGRPALAVLRRVLEEGVAPDGEDGREGLGTMLARLARVAGMPGLVAIVSDFRDGGWERPLRHLAARHQVLAVEVHDPREGALPDVGHLALVDPETGRQVAVDTGDGRLRRRYAAVEAGRRERVAAELRRAGAAHVALSTASPWLRELGRSLR